MNLRSIAGTLLLIVGLVLGVIGVANIFRESASWCLLGIGREVAAEVRLAVRPAEHLVVRGENVDTCRPG